jgi:hypothetical protein
MSWWRRLFPRRESYAEAYARITAEIERDYPLDQLRAMNKMKALQREIAREEVRRRLDGGGEYQRGMEGFQ